MPILGNIRTGDWVAKFDMTVDVAIHASGDLLAQAVEIVDAVKPSGVSIVQSVTVVDYDDQAANLNLLFFSEAPGSLGALNAAMAVSDGVAEKCIGYVTVDSWLDIGAQQIGTETTTGLAVYATNGGTSIWVAARSAGTGTYATGRLTVRLGLLRG